MGTYIKKVGKYDQVTSPVGELEWVMITGQGKLNTLNNKYYYQATVVLDPETEETKAFVAEIEEYWQEHKPKKHKGDAKSNGIYPHTERVGEDEDGDPIYEETGKLAVQFKTETTFQDGKAKKITLSNAKGAEVALGENKIGNGSKGRLQGNIKEYVQAKDAGISLYLNSIQLSKYVPYVSGPDFDTIEEEDGFEGFEPELPEVEESSAPAQPRL